MPIRIIADSGCDITQDEAKVLAIPCLFILVYLGVGFVLSHFIHNSVIRTIVSDVIVGIFGFLHVWRMFRKPHKPFSVKLSGCFILLLLVGFCISQLLSTCLYQSFPTYFSNVCYLCLIHMYFCYITWNYDSFCCWLYHWFIICLYL